jgi:DNA-binding LacI/PurR family transcriptional regulator
LGRIIQRGYPGLLYATIYPVIKDNFYRLLEPHFKETLRKKDVTAWICSNDLAAAVAMEYLKKHEVSVPEEISIISIDSSDDCILHGITAYELGHGRAGHLAAHYLLGDLPIKRNKNGLIHCPGEIIVRESVCSKNSKTL